MAKKKAETVPYSRGRHGRPPQRAGSDRLQRANAKSPAQKVGASNILNKLVRQANAGKKISTTGSL